MKRAPSYVLALLLLAAAPVRALAVNLCAGSAPGSERWTHQERRYENTPIGTVIQNGMRPMDVDTAGRYETADGIRATEVVPCCISTAAAGAQPTPRTILAIGAHAGDAELTMGPLLTAERTRGSRVVILDLTLGERGHPTLSAAEYGAQKRHEATAVAAVIGAELELGPYRDAEIPNDEATRRWVASVIRRVRPTLVVTHWKESMHRDHATTSAIVRDAVLLAALPDVAGVEGRPHRGVGVWYAENWEDATGFTPYIYVGIDTASWSRWRAAVSGFEFARGATGFRYVEYYDALGRVRGLEARKERAVAFDVEPTGKRRVLDAVP